MKNRHVDRAYIFSRYIWILAWLLALTGRWVFPLSDPPADLSWSGGYYADEGFWVHNARNEHLFGDSAFDQWNNKYVSPTVHFPVKCLFYLMGPNLFSVRIWAAVLSILTLILLHRIACRLDPSGVLFLLFAINSTLVFYQRIAILESAVLPVAALTLWLWLRSQEISHSLTRGILEFLTGVAAAWTWQIKSTQLYMIPVILLSTWLSTPVRKRALHAIFRQSIGIACVFFTWFFLIFTPNISILTQYNRFYISQQGEKLIDLVKNIAMQPLGIYFNRMPVLLPACLIIAACILYRRRFKLLPPAVAFSWVWFVAGVASLMPMGYRPPRYYLPLVIPMIILGFRFLSDREVPGILKNIPLTVRVFIAIFAVVPALTNVPFLLDHFVLEGRLLGLSGVSGFSVTGAVILLLTSFILSVFILSPQKMTQRFMFSCLTFCLIFHVSLSVQRLMNRTYDVVNTSRNLKKILPENSVLAGQWAPQLVLETPFRAVPLWRGFVNWQNPFEQYGITHILSWEYPLGNELEHQIEWFPQVMNQAELIKTYNIKNSAVSLRRIAPTRKVMPDGSDQSKDDSDTGHYSDTSDFAPTTDPVFDTLDKRLPTETLDVSPAAEVSAAGEATETPEFGEES